MSKRKSLEIHKKNSLSGKIQKQSAQNLVNYQNRHNQDPVGQHGILVTSSLTIQYWLWYPWASIKLAWLTLFLIFRWVWALICPYSPLIALIRPYLLWFALIRRYLRDFLLRPYSPLFALIHPYSRGFLSFFQSILHLRGLPSSHSRKSRPWLKHQNMAEIGYESSAPISGYGTFFPP